MIYRIREAFLEKTSFHLGIAQIEGATAQIEGATTQIDFDTF